MQKLLARITDSDEREKGFTLIELLVVIIIIGILAAIAIPIFLNQKKKATDATVKSDVRNAVSQVESYSTDASTSSVSYDLDTNKAALVSVINPSSGNTVQIIGDPADGYCVRGWNSNGTATSATNAYFYDSRTGSITKGDPTTQCGPTTFTKATKADGTANTAAAWLAL